MPSRANARNFAALILANGGGLQREEPLVMDRLIASTIEALRDCADDLEAFVQDKWGYDDRLAHKVKRDMDPAVRARALAEEWGKVSAQTKAGE